MVQFFALLGTHLPTRREQISHPFSKYTDTRGPSGMRTEHFWQWLREARKAEEEAEAATGETETGTATAAEAEVPFPLNYIIFHCSLLY